MKLPWVNRKHIAELERQLADLSSLTTLGLKADGEGIDMTASGPMLRVFAGLWVDLFHQNGGENFVTMSVRVKDPWWKARGRQPRRYTVTVEREGGESPAEQLARLRTELAALRPAPGGPQ